MPEQAASVDILNNINILTVCLSVSGDIVESSRELLIQTVTPGKLTGRCLCRNEVADATRHAHICFKY